MANTMSSQRAYDKKVRERRKKMFAKSAADEKAGAEKLASVKVKQKEQRKKISNQTVVDTEKYDSKPITAPVSPDYSDTVKVKRAAGKERSKALFARTQSLFGKWVAAGKESSKKKRESNKKKMMSGPVYRTKK